MSKRGQPRVQYTRTYVLLPPGCSPEWALAVVAATWDKHQYTLGASADDAGIGDLDVRRVITVNPQAWPRISDPGDLGRWFEKHYPGVKYWPIYANNPTELVDQLRKLDKSQPPPPPKPPPAYPGLRFGLHDIAGARWMEVTGNRGIALVHSRIQERTTPLDVRPMAANGVDVYWRINWGYGEEGTLPPPKRLGGWIARVRESIRNSHGLAGVHIGNEVNNPAEWVGGYPQPKYTLNPAIYADAYNRICDGLDNCPTPLAPSPLDPYNVVAGRFRIEPDPAEWAREIYNQAHRVDWIALHAKTQGSEPAECFSRETFQDPPLIGRYLHLATIEDQLEWIPPKFAGRPIVVTELNPQRRRDRLLGWDLDAAMWIREAKRYVDTVKAKHPELAGAIFYRYELAGQQAPFALQDRYGALEAIFE